MGREESRSRREALDQREIAAKMAERLVRCAALSALCATLREQVAEKKGPWKRTS